jgi:hypothetical protein
MITFLIDEVAKTLKENHWKSKKIPKEKSTSQKIIKKNYNAPEVKSAPEEKKINKKYIFQKVRSALLEKSLDRLV